MQVTGELRFASEHGKPVEGIILDEPFIQIMPVGRKVHFGVFLHFGLHELPDSRAVEQGRHAV